MSTAAGSGPDIPGLSFVRRIGSGGYADVFLYDQLLPERQVAVKVMRDTGFTAAAVAQFRAEADAMARLEHPNIVPVYSVGTIVDGRQYIVMMYYPKSSLSERVKRERLSVAEALRVGIQIGSAIETAHRAGFLHRDIKPANILANKYDSPGLTDFGIAAQMSTDSNTDAGVSVPWSPPEVLYATAPASVASDVYSFAATLWHLLVGRSPFEIPGGDNSQFALMRRIRDSPPPSTGRPDVPASLDGLLRAAMSPNPAARPASMLTFVRSLQAVEQELRYPRTPIVLADERTDEVSDHASGSQDATRLRPTAIAAQGPTPVAAAAAPASPPPSEPTRLRRVLAEPQPDSGEPQARPRWRVALAAAVVVAIVIGLGVWLNRGQPGPAPPETTAARSADPAPVGLPTLPSDRPAGTPELSRLPPPPGPLRFLPTFHGDGVVITWTYDNRRVDDWYQWRWKGETAEPRVLAEPSLSISQDDLARNECVEVRVVRRSGGQTAGYFGCCPASGC